LLELLLFNLGVSVILLVSAIISLQIKRAYKFPPFQKGITKRRWWLSQKDSCICIAPMCMNYIRSIVYSNYSLQPKTKQDLK
jgi:hypothetical protein